MLKKDSLFKFSMFFSSYFPLYLFILMAQINRFMKMITISKKGVQINSFADMLFFFGIIGAMVFSIVIVGVVLHTKAANHNIIMRDVEPMRDTTISYIATYIVPMTGLVNSGLTYGTLVANIGLFLLIAVLYVNLNLVYLNPLMVLWGYIPYFSDQQIIITDVEYRKIRDYKTRKWNGTHISSRIILIRDNDNRN